MALINYMKLAKWPEFADCLSKNYLLRADCVLPVGRITGGVASNGPMDIGFMS